MTAEHIQKTIYEKEQRMKLYEEKLDEMLEENVIMIDTEGAEIGQINGLAVLDMGNYAFGNPSRITATTYVADYHGLSGADLCAEFSAFFELSGLLRAEL